MFDFVFSIIDLVGIINFFLINNNTEIYSIVFAIGSYIQRGMSFSEAFNHAATVTKKNKYKMALLEASNKLNEGHDLKELLFGDADPNSRGDFQKIMKASLSFIPIPIKLILISNLKDTSKGASLCGWKRKGFESYEAGKKIYATFNSVFFAFITIVGLSVWILPEIIEEIHLLNYESNIVLEIVTIIMKSFFIKSILLVVLLSVLVFLSKIFMRESFKVTKLIEYSNFFKCLTIIDSEEFRELLQIFSSENMTYHENRKFRRYSRAIEQGASLEEAGRYAEIHYLFTWFLMLGFGNDNPGEMFYVAERMIDAKIENDCVIISTIFPTIGTIFVGLVVGFTVFLMFGLLNSTLVKELSDL